MWTWPIDDEATEAPQLRQVTSTPGGKDNLTWSADGKEIWFSITGEPDITIALERRLKMDYPNVNWRTFATPAGAWRCWRRCARFQAVISSR